VHLLRRVQLLRDRGDHLVRWGDELWVPKDRIMSEPRHTNKRNRGDALLLGHPLGEEGLCPETHLAIVVTERDCSLRWVMEGLDVDGGVGGVGRGGHGGWWWERRERRGLLPSDLGQRDG